EGAGERRVRVAVHDDDVGPLLENDPLELDEHPAGLVRMRAGADAEVDGRPRDVKLLEEHVRHAAVVVLAGMHDDVVEARPIPAAEPVHRATDRRDLHELRAGPDDAERTHQRAATATSPASGLGARPLSANSPPNSARKASTASITELLFSVLLTNCAVFSTKNRRSTVAVLGTISEYPITWSGCTFTARLMCTLSMSLMSKSGKSRRMP